MAKTTAYPSGVKRYFAGPCRNTTETNTQLIDSVETSVGTAMPAAPCSVAAGSHAFLGAQPVGVFDGHRRIVHEDADGQSQTAQGHRVDGVAQEVEDDEGREDRQRYRGHHHERR